MKATRNAVIEGRTRAPKIRAITCPTCHAGPGQPCHSSRRLPDGTTSSLVLAHLHRPRWRAAGFTPPPTPGSTGGKNGRPLSPAGIRTRSVICPVCLAPTGAFCITPATGARTGYHHSRQRKAGIPA